MSAIAISETNRRRKLQIEHNETHGIVPKLTVQRKNKELTDFLIF